MSLRMGDTVLVCVSAFKGRHKIQSRWENREYVGEWQPYPNLPVYLACPIDGEGHSHTLHRNYLLPISHNLEQEECDNAVEGGGNNEPTSVPHEEDVLPADCLTESLPEGRCHSPSKQCKRVDPEPTGLTSPDSMSEGLQANDDMPVPQRRSSRKMRNQLPWRYSNFSVWQNDILPCTFSMWVGLCICLHIVSCWYTICVMEYSVMTLCSNHHRSARCYGGFLDGGGPKDI